MYQKNKLWKDYLMHEKDKFEDEKNVYVDNYDDHKKTIQLANNYYNSYSKDYKEQDKAKVALANHEYYLHNKQWKKEYNAEYYQNNKDYWKRRYEYQKSELRKADNAFDNAIRSGNSVDANKYGDEAESRKIQMDTAYYNYGRAIKEEYDFIQSYKETPVSSFSQSIVDTGKSFLSTLKSGLNTLTSAISSGFSKLKSLFS